MVLDRLKTFRASPPAVFDNKVDKDARPPYLLVRTSLLWLGAQSRPDAVNLANEIRKATCTVRVYGVGESADAARLLFDYATDAFLNWRPVITGRVCMQMYPDDTFEATPDERTGVAYFEQGSVWSFTSSPA
ncbi:hypothetical protein [Actinoplanes italicus]|uniref:hypothetical protein n=1 Tax=Actinoplanes italicus TaxID=113567 RepID=UPI000D055290|nr:hypothetical protein [Actinoplanes italicus]